jgi:hypothetical protein
MELAASRYLQMYLNLCLVQKNIDSIVTVQKLQTALGHCPFRVKCIWTTYKDPLRTSQETHYASVTNNKRLMQFTETAFVYENIQTREYTLWAKSKDVWCCVKWCYSYMQ